MVSGSLRKAFRILRALADKGMNLNIRELSAEVNMPKSTTHRICHLMVNEGILKIDPKTKQYDWGPELLYISQTLNQSNEIRRLALPILREIVSQCDETAQLFLYDKAKRRIVFSEEIQSTQPIHYHTALGVDLPIHAGASGKIVMSYLPEKEIEEIISSGLEPVTDKTVTDANRLRQNLAKIRASGNAITFGERTPGAVGISCPIFDAKAGVIGGLVITLPAYRFQPKMRVFLTDLVRKGGERLSRLAGLPIDVTYPPPCPSLKDEKESSKNKFRGNLVERSKAFVRRHHSKIHRKRLGHLT